ncbi:MAG: F0F1 ATP synthase subunit A [Spirochaetota bacterium]
MFRLLQIFSSFAASAEGGHGGEKESINDIVVHHLGDSLPHFWPISELNEHFLNEKLFGMFDMRITKFVLLMWGVAIALMLIFIPVARALKKQSVSSSKWVNMWEALIGFVHDDIVAPNFDHHYEKKAMPYFCSLFFFVLICNYMGLIPTLQTPTGNLAVTAGLAILTLTAMIGVGVIKQGPFSYFKGLVPHGVPAVIGIILLFPIELLGLMIKPFALTIRLFANMTGGHVVVIVFLYLVMMFQNYFVGIGSVVGALMIYFLELLVAFIQAYIFASLSAMFIGSSLHAH